MALMPLAEAIAAHVHDGQSVALEGFTHLIPFAAGHEIVRQGRKDLHLIRMTPDLIYDQMIGMGCASRLTFSWGGNPGVGSLHRLRDAVEKQWPAPLAIVERTHAEMAVAYQAGASGLPFGVMRRHVETDLHTIPGATVKAIDCPFTGATLSAVPAIRPDVTILHAQQVDAAGNVLIRGIVGAMREAAMAARCLIVTVEEQVERLRGDRAEWIGDRGGLTGDRRWRISDLNAPVLPAWLVSAVCLVPGGAYPSYAQGYYPRDNRFYVAWDGTARDRKVFRDWMQRHVMGVRDHGEFLRTLGVAA